MVLSPANRRRKTDPPRRDWVLGAHGEATLAGAAFALLQRKDGSNLELPRWVRWRGKMPTASQRHCGGRQNQRSALNRGTTGILEPRHGSWPLVCRSHDAKSSVDQRLIGRRRLHPRSQWVLGHAMEACAALRPLPQWHPLCAPPMGRWIPLAPGTLVGAPLLITCLASHHHRLPCPLPFL